MSTFIALLALTLFVAGLLALVHLTREDRFAGTGLRHVPRDELGPLAFRRGRV